MPLKCQYDYEGKGPEKAKYEQQIKKLKLRRVAFRTMWLSAEDYPLLLGELRDQFIGNFL